MIKPVRSSDFSEKILDKFEVFCQKNVSPGTETDQIFFYRLVQSGVSIDAWPNLSSRRGPVLYTAILAKVRNIGAMKPDAKR